ncbi:hypothetical protein BT96DRAFT_949852 [Gymnopus androsaceus JB14]|uniref:Uncharacterized protein n=1 Tax=Gymnopus androsaceus JB14 TaxID=1447944 RepID=A0A6A4GJ75_9AGAR|nr:hypothetical protein BT96DRAFT_949852 [Gymnopus androsaceus JB14]
MTEDLVQLVTNTIRLSLREKVKVEMTRVISETMKRQVCDTLSVKIEEVFAAAKKSVLVSCSTVIDEAVNKVTIECTKSIIEPIGDDVVSRMSFRVVFQNGSASGYHTASEFFCMPPNSQNTGQGHCWANDDQSRLQIGLLTLTAIAATVSGLAKMRPGLAGARRQLTGLGTPNRSAGGAVEKTESYRMRDVREIILGYRWWKFWFKSVRRPGMRQFKTFLDTQHNGGRITIGSEGTVKEERAIPILHVQLIWSDHQSLETHRLTTRKSFANQLFSWLAFYSTT